MTTRDDIIRAVRDHHANAADDLHRCRAAFRRLSGEEMRKQYGESDKTCTELLEAYEAEEKRWSAALAEVSK